MKLPFPVLVDRCSKQCMRHVHNERNVDIGGTMDRAIGVINMGYRTVNYCWYGQTNANWSSIKTIEGFVSYFASRISELC